ncbi:MAG: carboxymethylenebutenolidase [Gammaproteobacteria bacterium]|nr:carboxymethylenebutenolidase [Gammaproteobacteria bacterium]
MLQERFVEYEFEGKLLEGFLAYDDSHDSPVPGVIVAPAWAGRGNFECDKARKLATLGYVGFACDLYGKGIMGKSVEENSALMQPFLDDRQMLQNCLLKILETLQTQTEVDENNIAAMGFCFGGLCVLDMARIGAAVKGVASFHGLFGAPGNTEGNKITAKVLALHGHEDPMAPVESVIDLENELTAAAADWQIHVYGGTMHAFTNPVANDPDFGTVYSENADKRSWQTLLNFLQELF